MRRSMLLVAGVLAASCGSGGSASRSCVDVTAVDGRPLRLVTTVAPITDVVEQLVAGTPTVVEGVVPAGRDSHTFEPTPGSARTLADADIVVMNGLDLEVPTFELARANLGSDASICELGNAVLREERYLFDRSFPENAGAPNPHVWMNPVRVGEYADVLLDMLVRADGANAATYRDNHTRFQASVDELDAWVREMSASVAPDRRLLLTYHDAYAYFAREYGWEVVDAVQPSSFDEPSPREVADLIEQVRDRGVTTIFGSEVYPSPVLEQIAKEGGATYVDDLRDDVLPGEPGDEGHSWQGMIRLNVTTIVEALGE